MNKLFNVIDYMFENKDFLGITIFFTSAFSIFLFVLMMYIDVLLKASVHIHNYKNIYITASVFVTLSIVFANYINRKKDEYIKSLLLATNIFCVFLLSPVVVTISVPDTVKVTFKTVFLLSFIMIGILSVLIMIRTSSSENKNISNKVDAIENFDKNLPNMYNPNSINLKLLITIFHTYKTRRLILYMNFLV